VRGRSQPDDEDAGVRVAGTGDRTPPVLMVGEPGDLVARDALAPRDETWTHAALDDVGRNEGELLSGHARTESRCYGCFVR
jgi:hypothetical protein